MKIKNSLVIGLLTVFAVLLVACSPMSNQVGLVPLPVIKRPSVTGATYLRQAASAEGESRARLQLKAATALLAEGHIQQASSVLRSIDQSVLLVADRLQLDLDVAAVQLGLGKAALAKSSLKRIDLSAAGSDMNDLAISRDRLLVLAYAKLGQSLMALRTQLHLLSLITDQSQRNQYIVALWGQLSHRPPAQLRLWRSQVRAGSAAAGWLDLALIMQRESSQADWQQAISRWQVQYPGHLAQILISGSRSSSQPAVQRIEKIALLLPLTGKYSAQGQAVRRGFYAAYFQARNQLGRQAPQLRLYDTNATDMSALLQQVIANGSTRIVGPLLKQNVATFLGLGKPDIPVLALNRVQRRSGGSVVQYTLSPEAAVDQVAAGIASAHRWRVAIVAPKTAQGARLVNRFKAVWSGYRGDVIGEFDYSDSADYARGIRHLLHIDRAYARKRRLQQALGKKVRFVVDRRRDIDAVFLVGDMRAAAAFKPLLKFYFAGSMPVYSAPNILSGYKRGMRNRDLNGIKFVGSPWAVAPASAMPSMLATLRSQLRQVWPTSTQRYGSFYAMGVDAFNLLGRLPMLQSLPQFSYYGETGILTINANGVIYPRLVWAQFKSGKPRLLASPLLLHW